MSSQPKPPFVDHIGYANFRRAMNSVVETPYSDAHARACWDTMHPAERAEWSAS